MTDYGPEEYYPESHTYDSVAAAAETVSRIQKVIESPTVDQEFKDRVLKFAEKSYHDLGELGLAEAANQYKALLESGV